MLPAPRAAAAASAAAALLWWCICSASWRAASGDGKTPSATIIVQALKPKGLRIAVPDLPGMDLVTINANINVPIDQKETGQLSNNVLEPRNGFWTLEALDVKLKPGDAVFYWAYIGIGDRGERKQGHQPIHELLDPSCRPSPTIVNGRRACAGQLVFEDNFDSFNTSMWKHSIQFSDDPDVDFSTYTSSTENSFVKDGKLHLRPTVLNHDELFVPTKLEGCTWTRYGSEYCERSPVGWNILPPTRSALLTTKESFSFKFGRVDISAKTAAGDWLLSRLILEPKTGAYGRAPYQSGRVEMLRSRGNPDVLEPSGWQLGARLNDPQADIHTCERTLWIFKNCPLVGKLYSDDYHLFSVTWTPFSLKISVDGECEHIIKPPEGGFLNHGYFKEHCHGSPWEKGTYMAPFDQEFYLHIGLVVAGFNNYHEGVKNKGQPKPWNDRNPRAWLQFWQKKDLWQPTWLSDMEVDYVKVWAL